MLSVKGKGRGDVNVGPATIKANRFGMSNNGHPAKVIHELGSENNSHRYARISFLPTILQNQHS